MEDEVVAPDTAPEVSAPETVAPVESATVEQAAPTEPETRRDTLERAFKNPNNRGKHAAFQPRAQGKFAPGQPQVPAEAPQRPAMIKSLRKELEPHWNAAPPELVSAFAEREAAFEKGANEWKTKAQQADEVLNAFKPYEHLLRAENSTPVTAINNLLQTAAMLRTGSPAQKAQSVAQVMQQYGIPLDHIAHMFGQAQTPVMDPHYNQLAQQVQQLTYAQQQQQQQQTQRAMSVIEKFASDPANTHFAALQPKMLALLQTPDILGPDVHNMSEREKLQLAYDTALRLDPQLSAQAFAHQQAGVTARQQAQAAVNAAKTAAVQVKGAPGAPTHASVNLNDRRSVIANALRAAQA